MYRDPADDFNPLGGNGRDYPYAGDEGGNGMPPRGGEDDDDDIGDFMQDEDDYDFNGGDGSQAFTFAGSLEEAGAGGGGVVRYWDDSADFNAAGAGAGVGVGSAEGVSTGDNDDDDDRDVDAGEIEHMLSLRPLNPYAAMLHEEEELARRVEDVLNEGLSQSNSTSSYETLCRKHIENFMKGAEEYARSSSSYPLAFFHHRAMTHKLASSFLLVFTFNYAHRCSCSLHINVFVYVSVCCLLVCERLVF